MTRIFPIQTENMAEYWDQVAPFLGLAADRYSKDYDITDVWDALLQKKALLFGIEVDGVLMGAMTVAPDHQPKRKMLDIELVGGKNADKWYYDTIQQLTAFAKQAGYDALRSNARQGWRKMAKHSGFKETSVTYELEI